MLKRCEKVIKYSNNIPALSGINLPEMIIGDGFEDPPAFFPAHSLHNISYDPFKIASPLAGCR